jgi:hypothetical protein
MLVWRRTATAGVWAGLAAACVLFPVRGPDGVPLASAVAMLQLLVAVPAVSLLAPAPDRARVDRAFQTGPAAEVPPATREVA